MAGTLRPVNGPKAAGPDFICIGMSRAGTGWLYDQLRGRPDFWMPPIKEVGYFQPDDPFPGRRLRKKVAEISERGSERREREDRDGEFLRLAGKGRGWGNVYGFYRSLFALKGEQWTGDITPGYSILSRRRIASIATNLPDTKVILLLREPVERCWSQLGLRTRGGRMIEEEALSDWKRIKAYISAPRVAGRCFPSRIYDRWAEHVPPDRLKVFFFDDIVVRPEALRGEILTYLGVEDLGGWPLPADYNRKSKVKKPVMNDTVRAGMVGHFAEELRLCATKFGGPAAAWPARHGL
jgi:hypothetical protein